MPQTKQDKVVREAKKAAKQEIKKELKPKNYKKAARLAREAAIQKARGKTYAQERVATSQVIHRNKTSGSPGAAQSAMLAVTCPGSGGDFRWNSEYATEPTAVGQPWDIIPVPWTAGSAPPSNRPLDTDESMLILRRSASCSHIFYDPNVDGASFQYTLSYTYADTNANVVTNTGGVLTSLQAGEEMPVQFTTAVPTGASTYHPHGELWFAASDKETDSRYFWFNWNDQLTFVWQNNSGANMVLQVRVYQYQSNLGRNIIPLRTYTSGVIATGASDAVTITPAQASSYVGGYFAFELKFTTGGGQYTITSPFKISGTNSVFCHRALPQLYQRYAEVESARIIGVSGMYSNTAAPINEQGKIVGVQVPSDEHWTTYIGGYNDLATLQGSVQNRASVGMFGYLKPKKQLDFEMIDEYELTGGTISDSFWDLNNNGFDYIIIYPKITTSAQAQDAYWTVHYFVEYRTTSRWLTSKVSSGDPETMRRAMIEIKTFNQWFDNPLHFSQIIKKTRDVVANVTRNFIKYGPRIMSAMEKYGPMAMQGAQIAASLL